MRIIWRLFPERRLYIWLTSSGRLGKGCDPRRSGVYLSVFCWYARPTEREVNVQVLGDLVKLSGDGLSLPLPWWQRAPLGLLNGTDVHVGLVRGSRPIGDIVVSVLDITKWDNMVRLECSHTEERGVLAGLMEAVLCRWPKHQLSIASVTMPFSATTGAYAGNTFCPVSNSSLPTGYVPPCQ